MVNFEKMEKIKTVFFHIMKLEPRIGEMDSEDPPKSDKGTRIAQLLGFKLSTIL